MMQCGIIYIYRVWGEIFACLAHVNATKISTTLTEVTSRLNTNAGRWTQLCHPRTTAASVVVTQKPATTPS